MGEKSNFLDPDTTPPTVLSITVANPSSTNQQSVDFTVTFSEPVTGIDMTGPNYDDFVLTTSPEITGAHITNITGSGAVYIVTVDTGTGDGTIRLDLVATTIDVTPPNKITDLSASPAAAHGTVDLSWTAPGNDGATGTAASYLVKFSETEILTEDDWNAATSVNAGIPIPQAADSAETMTVTAGLTPGISYYFAVRAMDARPNLAEISSNATAIATNDTTPPATILDLSAVSGASEGSVNLSWTAPGDDDSLGTATSYQVRYGSAAIVSESDWNAATPVNTGVPTPQTSGSAETLTVTGLTPGTPYYFVVRAQDEAANSGNPSNSPSATATTDTIAPAAITNLAATSGTTEGSINLTWTAPGDNGSSGTANGYLVRYSSSPITNQTSWDAATIVASSIPAPQTAGGSEAMTVNGLTAGATYYFALRAQDEIPNLGALSNSPSGVAALDSTAPAAITNLSAIPGSATGSIILTWTAPGDSGTTGTASSYIVKYSTSAITNETLWNAAQTASAPPTPKTAGQPETMTVNGLTGGTTYYFAVRAQDEIPNLGGLSNSPSAVAKLPPDTTSPSAITNLAATTGTNVGTVNLSWTAPGDDNTTGTVANYLVRYSTSAISDQTAWDNATPITSGLPTPKAAGQSQTMTVAGLNPGATYFFAVRGQDEVQNTGNLSNSPNTVAKAACGNISTNTTWTPAYNPYIVTCDINIAAGITLTIQPGTILKFNSGYGINIPTTGTLNAIGTADSPITFTSNQPSPAAGNWKGINFGATSVNSVLDHVVVEYGGGNFGANILTSGSAIQVKNSTIRYSGYYGIVGNGMLTLTNNTFVNNANYAAYLSFDNGNFTSLTGNSGYSNGKNGIALAGSISQNFLLQSNSEFPYLITGNHLTVNSGATLTIEADSIVKIESNATLTVNGALNVNGTISQPVHITSIKDDSVGGDSNNDGAISAPAAGDWRTILINGSAVIKYTEIRYGGSSCSTTCSILENNGDMVVTNTKVAFSKYRGIGMNGSGSISHSEITDNLSDGLWVNPPLTQSATINNNNIIQNDGYAISVNINQTATLYDNRGSGNKINGIGFDPCNSQTGGNCWSNSAELTKDTSWLKNDLPFILTGVSYGRTKISSTGSLTIEPGVVVKSLNKPYMSGLSVSGTLIANGTIEAPIYFTSINDDTIGGDTNNDLDAFSPIPGDWNGIAFLPGSEFSSISNIVIKYGGKAWYPDPWDFYTPGANISSWISNLSITNSDITYSSNYGIYNANLTTTIQARNNWWGDPSGPAPYGAGNDINYYSYTCGNPPIICNDYSAYVNVIPWIGQPISNVATYYGQNVPWNAYVSDPVNTATGNYAYKGTDLSISTRSLPLAFTRSYNSVLPANGPLGYGWTFSYNVYVTENTLDNSATVTYGDGRTVRFTWNGSSYTPPAGTFSTLVKVGGLFTLTEKDGTVYAFNASRKLSTVTDKNGNVTTLNYTGANLTLVTAPDGRSLTFSYDGSNRIIGVTDPLSRTLGFTYDGNGDLVTFTDLRNKNTTYTYDSSHRLLTITDANNHTFIDNTYNADGRVSQQLDAEDNLTTFVYDIEAHKTQVTDARLNTTLYEYDAELRLIKVTDPLGNFETYTWDAANNKTSFTDKRNNTTTYTYDSKGNLLTVTDPLTHTTTYTYDADNNLLTQTDANNHATTYTYDANNNLQTKTDAKTGLTTYTYYSDAARDGLLATTTDPLLRVTGFDYDTYGNLDSITDALLNVTTRTYDAGGRMLTETDPLLHTTTYTYDNSNRVLTVTDPISGVTTNTYDNVGNLLTTTDPNNHTTTYTYTAKDQIATISDAAGYVTSYAYDTVGNRTSMTDGNLHTTTYVYDAANQLISITNPLSKTTTFGYDANGNRTSVTDPLLHTTTYTYDALNRQTAVTDALTHTTTTTYDAVGNILSVTDANSHATSYEYDELNRLITVTDALSGEVSYTYDAVGNRLSMTDANNHTTTYTYDALNRLLTESDPLSHTWAYTYDDAGRRASREDAKGITTAYTYDAADRLTSINVSAISITYGYDAAGNRTSMTDATGTTTYTYDEIDRPLSIAQPNGTISYTYDAVNRLTVTLPGSRTTTYVYDNADQMTSATDWNSKVTSYTYDNAGRLTTTTFPNSVVTTNTYDNADRLTGIATLKNATSILNITYTLDNVGNRLTMLEPSGTTTYTYDALNRLKTVSYPTGSPANVSYTYDPMGNRLTLTEDGVTTTYTYDNADRLTGMTGGTSLTFTWDDNGQMLTKGSQTFTWDNLGRMAALTNGGTSATYTYNGDGVRVAKSVNGTATSYLQDLAYGLPVVLSETTSGSTSRYVYGSDLIANVDTVTTYLHTDGLGSTRAITNASGIVTDQYVYDAFGAERSHTGSITNPYTYTGEQVDPEAALVFLRARYYDPMIGRFMSRDRFPPNSNNNQTANRYIYVLQNPVKYVDPSGQIFCTLVPGLSTICNTIGKGPDAPPAPLSDLWDFKGDIATEAGLLSPVQGYFFGIGEGIASGDLWSLEEDKKALKGTWDLVRQTGEPFIDAIKSWWKFRKNGYRFSFVKPAFAAEQENYWNASNLGNSFSGPPSQKK